MATVNRNGHSNRVYFIKGHLNHLFWLMVVLTFLNMFSLHCMPLWQCAAFTANYTTDSMWQYNWIACMYLVIIQTNQVYYLLFTLSKLHVPLIFTEK